MSLLGIGLAALGFGTVRWSGHPVEAEPHDHSDRTLLTPTPYGRTPRAGCARAGRRDPAMTCLSVICLVSGTALAGLAPRRSVQQAALEGAGGGLIVLGLVIIGVGLPLFR